MLGTIKFYNDQKGFGFIIPSDGGENIFFHITQCAESYEFPQEGDEVSYEVGTGRDGRPAAQNVNLASAGGASSTSGDDEEGEEEEME